MATVDTTGWEAGRIFLPPNLWNTEIRPLLRNYDVTNEGIASLRLDKFCLTYAASADILYWQVIPNTDPEDSPWRTLRQEILDVLESVTWTKDTGGTLYGGVQDKSYILAAYGGRGRRLLQGYNKRLKEERTEGLIEGRDRKVRRSDIIEHSVRTGIPRVLETDAP